MRWLHVLTRLCKFVGWVFFILVFVGCEGRPQRLWLDAPGWSRAQLIGTTQASDPAPLAVDEARQRVYLFLISKGNGVSHPRVLALNQQMDTVWERTFQEVELRRSHSPRLLWDGQALQLFWLSDDSLYNVRVGSAGDLLSAPARLTGDALVAHYDVAAGHGPERLSIWYSGPRQAPGLYALPPGDLTGETILIDEEGVRPDLQYDETGTLHTIWAHYPAASGDKPFFYAAYADGRYEPGREARVAAPRVSGTTVLEGPTLGLDRQRAYLFWSLTYYGGMQAGEAEAYYVTLPRGEPAAVSQVRRLSVPYSYSLPYQPAQSGGLNAGVRAPMGPDFRGGASYVTEIAADPTAKQELAIAFHVRMAYLMRSEQPQVGAVFLQDGVPAGYQLLSFTARNSTDPAILSDEAGYLYLTWLERAEDSGFIVYFTSTAPGIRSALGGITADDAGRLTAETAFGLLSGALLVPFTLAWIIMPAIVLAVTSWFRGHDESPTEPGTILSLVLTLIAYWAGKLFTLPQILDYVPFSAWLPVIPPELHTPLRIGVPLLIAALGLLAAWHYTYRRDGSRSVFTFMIVYVIVDGLLTTSIYGVLVYAAF